MPHRPQDRVAREVSFDQASNECIESSQEFAVLQRRSSRENEKTLSLSNKKSRSYCEIARIGPASQGDVDIARGFSIGECGLCESPEVQADVFPVRTQFQSSPNDRIP